LKGKKMSKHWSKKKFEELTEEDEKEMEAFRNAFMTEYPKFIKDLNTHKEK